VQEVALRERIRAIIRQVCKELGVQIVSGILSREHVHMLVEIPPHHPVSDFVRRIKGRSSHRLQRELPDLRKPTWGGISGRATTSGNITDDVILPYLQEHEPTRAVVIQFLSSKSGRRAAARSQVSAARPS
jgi:putative transposase